MFATKKKKGGDESVLLLTIPRWGGKEKEKEGELRAVVRQGGFRRLERSSGPEGGRGGGEEGGEGKGTRTSRKRMEWAYVPWEISEKKRGRGK